MVFESPLERDGVQLEIPSNIPPSNPFQFALPCQLPSGAGGCIGLHLYYVCGRPHA